MDPASSPRPARHRDVLAACVLLSATVVTLVALGHDGRRIAQLLALAAPALVWMVWPVRSPALHRLRTVAVWSWAMLFAFDAVLRAYLLETYQAAPDASMVLGAAANTNAREGAEYVAMHWRAMTVWSLALAVAAWLFGRSVRRGNRVSARWPRWAVALMCASMLVSCIAYASKSSRRHHPLVFWSGWIGSVDGLRAGWADQQKVRDRALARARGVAPVITQAGPSTVVLVITDSINRDNMSLYGYDRATTPRLVSHKKNLDDRMLVLQNAWSADASTLPSLRNMFGFGQPVEDDPQHAIALARAAGYKVWWMSNHDDVAIEQQHARMADVVEMVNRTPGRASASLDGELLDCIQEALEDPTERKLIIVHLMGAHPHYNLRYPAGHNPFDDDVDAVERGLIEKGRSLWVRQFRQEYDAAMLYHDFVVSETLQLARTVGRADEYRAWMYLSDHGQEVGHVSDRAGHSPSTASGYRIPTLVWRNRGFGATTGAAAVADRASAPNAGVDARRPFRADWAGWTLADLLKLDWPGRDARRNVLDPAYVWQPPTLPVAVDSFER